MNPNQGRAIENSQLHKSLHESFLGANTWYFTKNTKKYLLDFTLRNYVTQNVFTIVFLSTIKWEIRLVFGSCYF